MPFTLRLLGGSLLMLLCAMLPGFAADATYTNPVGGDIRMGDPFVLLEKGVYYLYGTTAGDGFLCWSSPDLVQWQPLGYAFKRNAQSWGTKNFWAPEVTKYKEKFYLVYSVSGDDRPGYRLCVAVSDQPQGPYTDLHAPWVDTEDSCIDADLFIDANGTPYLFFNRVGKVPPPGKGIYGHIYGVQLTEDLSAMVGKPVLCAKPEQPWEEPDPKYNSSCNEGAYVIKIGDVYYLTFSSGHYASPKYAIGYLTAPAPLGPWTKCATPLLMSDLEKGISGPGHSCFTTSPDGRERFIVYHAHADPARPSGSRTVNIDRLTVTPDGALRVDGPTRTPRPMPSGSPAPLPAA